MNPKVIELLIITTGKSAFPLDAGGQPVECCLLLESGSPNDLLLEDETGCLELESC